MHLVAQILGGILLMFVGFQIGSIVEYNKRYNFADLELDLLHSIESRVLGLEAAAKSEVGKVATDVQNAL